MLNRKLVKTGLFTSCLMLLTTVVSAAGQPPADSTKSNRIDSIALQPELEAPLLRIQDIQGMTISQAPAIRLNKQAEKFMDVYIPRNSEMLEKIKAKHASTFATINKVLVRYNLPVELKYLAVIESELKARAVSRVGAVGYWQLMPATARLLSLKVTPKYDERTQLYKSTVAAAKYLSDLHDQFDDWLLVIAAYNSGPGTVQKAIRNSGSRNFWKLQYFLPAETRGHVKRFISTHYFFEGKGSLTTLTKEETALHNEAMSAFVRQNSMPEEMLASKPGKTNDQQPVEENKTARISSNAVGILTTEEE